ncbi:hypothetical protein ALC57_04767 [Trachymyrmex cornetzi]|uniref:Uncharacterized protein n=1 Tax=Trachymyrmex cornetzi TaxID=471704 RepID=A0A195EDR2_9HYME|nr:hypothetical protein ALC57_04767 [Trachymyrmex cornetzi]
MGTNRVRFHFIFCFELAAHSWQRVTNGEEAPDTRSCGRNGPYETRRWEQVPSSVHPLSMPMLNPLHASADPGRRFSSSLAGKGFAAAKRECEVRHKAVDHGSNATRGLFVFLSVDIAQLKSTSVVTRRHNRLRRKGLDLTKVNREGFERVRNLPADFVHSPIVRTSTPLWTLRINHVASLLLLQIQSYVPLLTVRRLIELTRNLVFVFKSCHAILITIKARDII